MNKITLKIASLLIIALMSLYGTEAAASTGRNAVAVTVSISVTIPERITPAESFIQDCVVRNHREQHAIRGECTTPRSLIQTVRHNKNVTALITPI